MSKEIKVPIPQSMIDEASSGEVKRLQRKVTNLEKKIKKLSENEEKAKKILDIHKELREYVKDHFDLYYDYYEDW